MSYHRLPLLHMLPYLAKLSQSICLVHVGITPDIYLYSYHRTSITLSIRLDDGV
jgi:hypothetical protein